MNKSYQCLLFDWDGCLLNTLSIWMRGYIDLFAEYGVHPTRQEIATKVMSHWDGVKNVGITDADGFMQELLRRINPKVQTAHLHRGVRETLIKLKARNKKIAIITSGARESVMPALERLELTHIYNVLLTREDVTKHKPDPEVVYKALELLGGAKEQALIVGDADKDIGAGKNAKITTVVFYPKANETIYRHDFLRGLAPDHLIKTFPELLTIVG